MRTIKILAISCFLLCGPIGLAQKSIKEYVTKNSSKKIQKMIMLDILSQPTSSKANSDGHGKGPYWTSKDQFPKTIALITYNISDYGYYESNKQWITYGSLTPNGGNLVATKMLDQTIVKLKETFNAYGAKLLTPDEFLDTPEKKAYYLTDFTPTVSKTGKFLSNIENRTTDIVASADGYRYFDMGAAFDFRRAESLGGDLAKKLGVDAVLSIGITIQTIKNYATIRAVKVAMHGPNPVPRQNKKYVNPKLGTGYYEGQIYTGATLMFKKPIPCMVMSKNEITEMNFDGLEVILEHFLHKFYGSFNWVVR